MRSFLLCPALMLLAACASPPEISPAYQYIQADDAPNYLLRLPEDYEGSNRRYPLLIFLHGIGEKGSGSEKAIQRVSLNGPFRSMRDGNWDTSLPLIVAGPQIGGMKWWWPTDQVAEYVQYLVNNYRVDRNRIYVTGVSMGGRAAWDLAEQYPQRAAAIIPAGAWAEDLSNDCASMRDIAVWAFHGTEDGLIKFRDGLKPVETLRDCDPSPRYAPSLTPLQGADHGNWQLVYDNQHGGSQVGADGETYEDIYRWLLTFSRDIDPQQDQED
jgi:predicted peptidase